MMITSSLIDAQLKELDLLIDRVWSDILFSSRLVKSIEAGNINKALYAIYMIETYHYTSHNSRNQALVGVRHTGNPVYTKFCFEHASGEVGHERMALHDLLSIGIKNDNFVIPKPLPATEILIAYLYWISFEGNPLRRLGYSYWAESSYQYINPLIAKVRDSLKLEPTQLTFFIAHSAIDAEHAEEVKSIMKSTCKDSNDWEEIKNVAETSLKLTGNLLDAVYQEYQQFILGESKRYAFLSDCIN